MAAQPTPVVHARVLAPLFLRARFWVRGTSDHIIAIDLRNKIQSVQLHRIFCTQVSSSVDAAASSVAGVGCARPSVWVPVASAAGHDNAPRKCRGARLLRSGDSKQATSHWRG